MKLILFDIDGTLLDAGDLSRRSFSHVIGQFAGPGAALGEYSLSGKTDPQIMRGLLLQNGVPAERVGGILEEALRSYESCYLAGLARVGARPLAGAGELVEHLTSSGIGDLLLGILSGNLRGLIVPKLIAARIPPESFPVVVCGSDNADRNELPAIAVERAQDCCGAHLQPGEVVIVGDTPLDVTCAQHFGAMSVAVATGDYTYEQLHALNPTYLLTSLLAWGSAENETL
jgi:phosphoglycolate phosphatase